MNFTSWLCCILLSLHTLTGTGLEPLVHVERELCPSRPLGAHGGPDNDPAQGSQGLATRLLSAVADRQQPGGMLIRRIVLGRGDNAPSASGEEGSLGLFPSVAADGLAIPHPPAAVTVLYL